MAEENFPYHKIKTVHTTYRTPQANKLLKSGWILLDMGKSQEREHDISVCYVLGTFENVEPPLSDEELFKVDIEKILTE